MNIGLCCVGRVQPKVDSPHSMYEIELEVGGKMSEMEGEASAWDSLELDDSDIIISSSFSLRRCRIPGPAAAVHAAMHRRTSNTQEYIRRVGQDSDLDFSRDPWIFAIEGESNNRTTLKDINKCFNAIVIDKVVAVVKTCTPNGLGDMILTLKDPTDTIAATVHRKLLAAPNFITAGSILILHKVVAFPSTFHSCCLNITTTNLVKVISVNCQVQYFPDSAQEKNSERLENTTNLVPTSSRRLSEDAQLSYHVNDNVTIQVSKDTGNCSQTSSLSRSKHMENSTHNISDESILNNLVDSGHKTLGSSGTWRAKSCTMAGPGTETVGVAANCEDFARDVSSAPSMIENHGNRHAWRQRGPELERMFKSNICTTTLTGKRHNPDFTSAIAAEKVNEVGHSNPNYSQKHDLQMDINYVPGLGENREIVKPNDGKEWMHLRDTQSSVDLTQNGSETKKQRLGLISKSSVQEWTDEQLCVLEMDEE